MWGRNAIKMYSSILEFSFTVDNLIKKKRDKRRLWKRMNCHLSVVTFR
jgi:hypothetical protein